VPKTVPLKDPKGVEDHRQADQAPGYPEKITGRAQFGMDVQFEGLLTAVVARPPVFGGKVKSLPLSHGAPPGSFIPVAHSLVPFL
jgi:isoquinoline 1-oxidoreductase beta subunit